MVIGLILVYGAFCLTGSYENLQKIYLRFGFVFGIVPTILILLWILFRSKTVHFSKKACLFLLIPLSALMLNGCVGSVQMEDRNDVMAMGIDYDHVQKKLIVSMSFPDVAALTGEGEYLSFPAVSLTADNLQAAKEQFHRESNKRLDYGQIQAIVLGQSVLESRAVLESVLTYMKQHQEFTRTTYICAAKGHACDIIALDESVNGSIGIYLKELFENNWTADHHETAILNDVLVGMENPRESIELVIVDNQGELPYICGKTEMKF